MRRPTAEAGFSLVDITVGLAIMSMLLLVSLAMGGDALARWRLERTANDIAASLLSARSKAIFDRVETAMDFDPTNARYMVTGQGYSDGTTFDTSGGKTRRVVKLTPGVRFAQPTGTGENNTSMVTFAPLGMGYADDTAVFDSRGILKSSSLPAYVYLGDPRRKQYRRVAVNLIGVVTVERWEGSKWR